MSSLYYDDTLLECPIIVLETPPCSRHAHLFQFLPAFPLRQSLPSAFTAIIFEAPNCGFGGQAGKLVANLAARGDRNSGSSFEGEQFDDDDDEAIEFASTPSHQLDNHGFKQATRVGALACWIDGVDPADRVALSQSTRRPQARHQPKREQMV